MYKGRFIISLCILITFNLFAGRSLLYPENWSLGYNYNGAKLQDYSFAGYKNNNVRLPNWNSHGLTTFKVDDYGGDPSGSRFSDSAIQTAISRALANNGGIILFNPGTYKVRSQFTIPKSNIFIVGTKRSYDPSNTTNFTRIITDYTGLPGNKPQNLNGFYGVFEFKGSHSLINKRTLAQDIEPDDTQIRLTSVSGYSIGDDIAIVRKVSGGWVADWEMAQYWGSMIDQEKVIEKRHVVSINYTTRTITLNAPTRHFVKASEGSVSRVSGLIENVGMYNINFNNALATIGTAESLGSDRIFFLKIENAKNAIVTNVRTFDRSGDSTNKHMADSGIRFNRVKDSTISNVHIFSTQNRLEGGHGYGIDLVSTSHVLVHGSVVKYNRHNYVFNGNGLDKEGNAVVSSHSGGARAKNCGGGICVTINAAGIDCHGSASVGMVFTDVTVDDKIECKNRKNYSSNAGQTGTMITMWNARGDGHVKFEGMRFHLDGYGWVMGYMIGTGPGFSMKGDGDWREHHRSASSLQPQNLYCDQLTRRHAGGNCSMVLPVISGTVQPAPAPSPGPSNPCSGTEKRSFDKMLRQPIDVEDDCAMY